MDLRKKVSSLILFPNSLREGEGGWGRHRRYSLRKGSLHTLPKRKEEESPRISSEIKSQGVVGGGGKNAGKGKRGGILILKALKI